jgi:hypothetical protein
MNWKEFEKTRWWHVEVFSQNLPGWTKETQGNHGKYQSE